MPSTLLPTASTPGWVLVANPELSPARGWEQESSSTRPAQQHQRVPHLEHFDVEDEGLGVLLEFVEVGVAQGVVLVQLGDAAAVPLPLQRVLPRRDVAQALGHQRVKHHVLRGGRRRRWAGVTPGWGGGANGRTGPSPASNPRPYNKDGAASPTRPALPRGTNPARSPAPAPASSQSGSSPRPPP